MSKLQDPLYEGIKESIIDARKRISQIKIKQRGRNRAKSLGLKKQIFSKYKLSSREGNFFLEDDYNIEDSSIKEQNNQTFQRTSSFDGIRQNNKHQLKQQYASQADLKPTENKVQAKRNLFDDQKKESLARLKANIYKIIASYFHMLKQKSNYSTQISSEQINLIQNRKRIIKKYQNVISINENKLIGYPLKVSSAIKNKSEFIHSIFNQQSLDNTANHAQFHQNNEKEKSKNLKKISFSQT